MVMIKIKFQTQELYSVQLKSLNILHKTTGAKEHGHFTCTMYSAYISFKSLQYYLFWVLVDMIKDFLYQRYNNQPL